MLLSFVYVATQNLEHLLTMCIVYRTFTRITKFNFIVSKMRIICQPRIDGFSLRKQKMAPRPLAPSPTNPDASDLMKMMESCMMAMQQQNASLVQQNTMALQQLEVTRVSVEIFQRQYYVELMSSGRFGVGPSSSSTQSQEWSLESFLQHYPSKFNGKVSPNEVDQWFLDMERI